MPDATQATFESGLRSTNTEEALLSIILYSPNLELVTSLDNSNSACTSSYDVSVSRGFTFTSSQSISISVSAGINIKIFTAGVTTTYALSFTESWTKTETRTVKVSCPPGEMAFVYQGTLMARILQLDTDSGAYEWYSTESKVLTDVTVTSSTPIGKAPSNEVQIVDSTTRSAPAKR